MTNYEYFNYTSLGFTSSKTPIIYGGSSIIHLLIETNSAGTAYMVIEGATQAGKEVWKSIDKMDNWAQVDVDPGNVSGDNKSRLVEIVSFWHDRANTTIYGVDGRSFGSVYLWKIDYSTDTTTETDSLTGGGDHDYIVYDVFMMGSDVYIAVLHRDNTGGPDFYLEIFKVVAGSLVEQVQIVVSGFQVISYLEVIDATNAYFWYAHTSGGNHVVLYHYDGANTLTEKDDQTDFAQPIEIKKGIGYDGNNILYYVLTDTDDSKDYLCSYNISGDVFTQLGEYNIVLMLDRNTNSTANPPNNLEKAFHVSEDKIYQIPTNYSGNLNLISVHDFQTNINSITDHFVMTNGGHMHEYENLVSHIVRMDITHDKEDFPVAKGILRRDKITLTKNLFMQIIGSYSADQTTLNSQVVFEGKIQNKDGKKLQTFDVLNQGVEMTTLEPSGTISETTNDIIKAINAGSNSIVNTPTYIHDGTLSVGQSLVNIVFEGDKSYKTIVNHLKDVDKFLWNLRPQGAIDYNDGTVDSGVDLRRNGNSFVNLIWNVNTFELPTGVNRVEVKGALNLATGKSYSGSWDGVELQQAENVKLFSISDASLNSNSLCNIAAQSIGERESADITTVQFNVHDTSVGLIQPGQTITFEYLSNDVNVPVDQLIIDKLTLEIKSQNLFIEASSGLLFEYKRDSPLENLVEENSQLIRQNARFSQGLQSDANSFLTQTDIQDFYTITDINALNHLTQTDINDFVSQTDINAVISDIAYNQSTWNAITTIAPSKNAVRDKFESLSSGISQTDFNVALMIGEANAALIPCAYQLPDINPTVVKMETAYIRNTGTGNSWLLFICPLPTNRGGKKLYIGDLVLHVNQADGTDDFINQVIVNAVDYNSLYEHINDGTNRISQGVYTYTAVGADISAYAQAVVQVKMDGGNGRVAIASVLLECYYDD